MRFIIIIALFLLLSLSAIGNAQQLCACPFNYAPVCGSDGRTYSNECVLRCSPGYKTVARQGEC